MMLLILLLVFASATLLAFAVLTRQRLEMLPSEAMAPVRYDASHAPSGLIRMLYPVLDLLAPLFAPLPVAGYRRSLGDTLRKAGFGEGVTVNHILALKLITAIATPFLLRLVIDSVNWPPLFLAVMIGGFLVPDKLINDIKKALRSSPKD